MVSSITIYKFCKLAKFRVGKTIRKLKYTYSFKLGLCTKGALLKISKELYSSLNISATIAALFIDITKAFKRKPSGIHMAQLSFICLFFILHVTVS